MRFPVWPLAVFLCLGACKSKPTSSTSTAPPDSTPAAAPADKPPAAAPPDKAPVWPKVTPEQASSTVVVRVVAGGIPPKSYIGAILHRDELADSPSLQGNNRCVLTVLSGWEDAQLRNPACHFFVTRNRTDNAGDMQSSAHAARLLQFDTQTGLATLRYAESFDSTLEAGYHLERSPQATDRTVALRSITDDTAPVNPASAAGVRRGAPLVFQTGSYSAVGDGDGNVQFPSSQNGEQPDEGPALIASNDKLIAFVPKTISGRGKLVTFGTFKLDVKVPMLNPVSIAFGKRFTHGVPFVISTEASGPRVIAPQVRLRYLQPGESPTTVPNSTGVPVGNDPHKFQTLNSIDGIKWTGSLPFPDQSGAEAAFLLELAWSPFPEQMTPSLFSRTFTVKLKTDAQQNVVAEVEGIENLNSAHQPTQGASTSFAVEAKIRDLYEMAGGREVLFRLEGPPFWKRFSLTRQAWLPLPAVNLSNVFVTGNLNALFILDRGAAEVRKYSLADLHPLGAIKLPAGTEYPAILAGGNSEHGPLHVLTKDRTFALSAETLRPRDYTFAMDRLFHPNNQRFSTDSAYQATGDGLSIIQYRLAGGEYLHYTDDATGTHREYFGGGFGSTGNCGVPVSAAFVMEREGWLTTIANPTGAVVHMTPPPGPNQRCVHWMCPVAPVIFRRIPADETAIPPHPCSIQCFSYYDSSPFAEVPTPEFNDQAGSIGLEQNRWLAFDPYSLRLGVLSMDRKSWVVHQIAAAEGRTQPILLNWPDPTLQRGTEWRFKPLLLGGTDFTAELLGASQSSVRIQNGEIVANVSPQEFASLQLLNIKVPGKDDALTYGIPLHVFGPQLPVVAPVGSSAPNFARLGASFDALYQRGDFARTLPTSVQAFAEPVHDILGPAAGHLIFVTDSQQVEFFSLESKKIVKAITGSTKATYFAGAEALFEYDTSSRNLTRISVPDGRRERTITLPNGLRLHGFAVGRAAGSPLTLLLEQIQGESSGQLGDLTLTLTYFDRDVVVVDSRTLAATGWAQPRIWTDDGKLPIAGNPYNFGALSTAPRPLAVSHNGLFITLPQIFLSLGRAQSLSVLFPPRAGPLGLEAGLPPPTGSISGAIVANSLGTVFNGGISDNYTSQGLSKTYVTPCGRYRLVTHPPTQGSNESITVQTVENNHALFDLGRLDFNDRNFDTIDNHAPRRLFLAGDSGPLLLLGGAGKVIQLVDFDIPRLARELLPKAFHVTSQGPPSVMAGGSFDYQIEVNNPAAVASCRLRSETPGATLTAQGQLHYLAPQVTQPTRVQISTEIEGKDGQTVIHEIPVFVLPLPRAAPAPAPTPFLPRRSV